MWKDVNKKMNSEKGKGKNYKLRITSYQLIKLRIKQMEWNMDDLSIYRFIDELKVWSLLQDKGIDCDISISPLLQIGRHYAP